MSTFQGFKIAEIDRNKSPDFTSEDIYFKRLYFVLEPIDGCADVERQKVWGFSFRWMVKNWKRYPELNDYEETLEEVPQLKFILDDNDNAVICAEGSSLQHLFDCIDFIILLVEHANSKFIKLIGMINRFRDDIDQLNARYFGN